MKSPSKPENPPLLRRDYIPEVAPYLVEIPEIKSGAAYYFKTDSGLRYQVLFARKRENYLEHIVNFSVLNEEFEDEYSETNRGEIYRVIATVVEIISIYHANHIYSISYEFTGEYKKENKDRETSIRTLLYFRKARKIMHPSWTITKQGNKVTIFRRAGRT